MRIRRKVIYVGAEQSGKSFLMQHRADRDNKKGKTAFVYNVGGIRDFTEYTEIDFPTLEDLLQDISKKDRATFRINPRMKYFILEGEKIPFPRFNAVTKGKRLKAFKLMKSQEEMLFMALAFYASGLNFMIDDARSVLGNALTEKQVFLFSRKNHSGRRSTSPASRGAGMDISAVFHSLDYVTAESLIYATHIQLFRTVGRPRLKKFKDSELIDKLSYCFEELKNLPPYHSFLLDLKTPNGVQFKHCKPIKQN